MPPLSPGIVKILNDQKATLDNFMQLSIEEMRSTLATMYKTGIPPIEITDIEDVSIKANDIVVRVRIYQDTKPHNANKFDRQSVLVYFHGGGWVLGDLEAQDRFCRLVAKEHNTVVISVDYRLAPENKFPSAVDDGLAVLQWIVSQGENKRWDVEKIVLAGDSAGGNLSAVVGKIFTKKSRIGKIVQVVMIYPVTDLTNFETESYYLFAKGYMLDREEMIWYKNQYLNSDEEAKMVEVSPLLDTDFSDYPTTVVITAGYDVLRDEGISFAQKLQEAGIECELVNFENLTHSFLRFADFDSNAKQAIDEVVKLIGRKWD